jgi:hypothetical protein
MSPKVHDDTGTRRSRTTATRRRAGHHDDLIENPRPRAVAPSCVWRLGLGLRGSWASA